LLPALFGNNQAEGFHDTAYLVRYLNRHLQHLMAGGDQRANKHCVKALRSNLAVKANLGKVGLPICVVHASVRRQNICH
jgi:hypothetical protein